MKYVLNQRLPKQFFSVFFVFILGFTFSLQAAQQILINGEEGHFQCAGGAQTVLLNEKCKKLTLRRVVFSGAPVYEAECLDLNSKDHYAACTSFTFQYKNKKKSKESFWQKSDQNKN